MPLDAANIKVLALWQPWASLLVMSDRSRPPLKSIETRGWTPACKLPFWCAIHASKRLDLDVFTPNVRAMIDAHASSYYAQGVEGVPLGAIVGVVQVYHWRTTGSLLDAGGVSDSDLEFGDYSANRYGWLCRLPHFFDKPIPHRGKQGLYAPTSDEAEQILIAMSEAQARRGVYGWDRADPEMKVA